ncbi:hypothetical protein LOY38_18345 [Pseudomonas sp. B21-015]|uniref:hypothetical protein n=1 Tax=Pseudomonas sp. B21-015 TaxID=2895473 RepID=UPI00215F600D|nr:hypothetical protein [Pseudomonas sp. B21-015]UVM48342.1 hypothetical protein LOY38_18345 [Pseudomonas sp. B21-015]
MKSLISLVPIAMLALVMNAHAAEAVREAPSSAIDRITLIYLDHKIYPNGSVECDSKVVGARSMVGCWNLTLNGKSSPHIWLYDAGKFKSVNGNARQLAQGKFSNEPDIAVMSLPLPADIDVGSTLESFTED